jgi:uncharacterized membrane protein YphA (DoxX/SURF4 family)
MERVARIWLLLIQIALGYEWLRGGLGKLATGGGFPEGLCLRPWPASPRRTRIPG